MPFTATEKRWGWGENGEWWYRREKEENLKLFKRQKGVRPMAERRGCFHSHRIEDQFCSWVAVCNSDFSGKYKNKAGILGRHMHRNTRSRSGAGLRQPQKNHQFRICNNVLEVEQVGWFCDFLKGNGHDFLTVRLKQDRGYLHPGLDFLLGK